MNPVLEKLIELLSLERLEVNLFRGISHNIETKRVFGGQVLDQAIKAAQYTVGDRRVLLCTHISSELEIIPHLLFIMLSKQGMEKAFPLDG